MEKDISYNSTRQIDYKNLNLNLDKMDEAIEKVQNLKNLLIRLISGNRYLKIQVKSSLDKKNESQFTNNTLIIMFWEIIATNLSNTQIFKKLLFFVYFAIYRLTINCNGLDL